MRKYKQAKMSARFQYLVSKSLLKLQGKFCHGYAGKFLSTKFSLDNFGIDFKSLKSPQVVSAIEQNIRGRKGVGNIHRVVQLKEEYDKEIVEEAKETLYRNLLAEALQLPNSTHPAVESYKNHPYVLKPAQRLKHSFPAKEFSQLAKHLHVLRTEALTALTGERSYYFLDQLADLEQALIKFVLCSLKKKNFELVSVPDILDAQVIEQCGMAIRSNRSQIYFLDQNLIKEKCLSGTSEMALAGMLAGRILEPNELPLRLAAVSRCYRSEASNAAEERGIYRVHQFTKVEMFGVCQPEQSEQLLAEFLAIEEENFTALELDFQVLDMPLHELAAPAYRKHDIEAWFPGRQSFGEISSCSNCTDYQARRLKIRSRTDDGTRLVHTTNGTACAIPRMVMALLETHQQADSSIRIPKALAPYFGQLEIRGASRMPKLKLGKGGK